MRAGTYAEQLTISTDGIALVGHGAVLVPPMAFEQNTCTDLAGDGTEVGICVTGAGVDLSAFVAEHRRVKSVADPVEDVTVAGFEVRGFSGANVAFVGAADAWLTGNRLVDGPIYGTLTAGSTNTRFTGQPREQHAQPWGSSACAWTTPRRACWPATTSVATASGSASRPTAQPSRRTGCTRTASASTSTPASVAYVSASTACSATNPQCVTENPYGNFGIIVAGAVGADVRGNWVDGQRAAGKAVGVAVVDGSTTGPFATGNTVQHNVIVGNDLDVLVATAGTGNVVARNHCETSTPEAVCD